MILKGKTAIQVQDDALLADSIAVRADRDSRLSTCDWTQVADAPVNKQDWAKYRQALRDITKQSEFPYNVVWPVVPT